MTSFAPQAIYNSPNNSPTPRNKLLTLDLARQAGLSPHRFPKTFEEADLAEKAVEKHLGSISIEEHEKAIFELHGISHDQEDGAEFVASSLERLEEELNKITSEDKEAYELALSIDPSYVTNNAFRIMFLRHDQFDAEKAAQMIVWHFEAKRRLFGSGDILVRDIRQSDLSETDLSVLRRGLIRVWPKPDAMGRIVLYSCGDDFKDVPAQDTMRAFWYIKMVLLRDEEVQKRGSIHVTFCPSLLKLDLDFLREENRLESGVPLRMVALHFCFTNPLLRLLATGFQLFMDNDHKGRVRLHPGSTSEICFKLQTFGIPVDGCIIGNETESKQAHLEWIESLHELEGDDATREDIIITPRKQDVLFGKNTKAKEHAGNMRAHDLVEEHFNDYEHANKSRKTDIANYIIKCIHDAGGRFLKQETDAMWVEVPDTVARQKIAHWYRHLRHKKKHSKQTVEIEKTIPKRVSPEPSPIDPLLLSPEKMIRIC